MHRTGTEEERTERGQLLEDIAAIVEGEKAAINTKIGADNENQGDGDEVFTDSDLKKAEQALAKFRKEERAKADVERDNLLNNGKFLIIGTFGILINKPVELTF